MGYRLQPSLVNGRFGDPGLYVGFQYKARALLFDIGDVSKLAPSQLRVVSDLFISHAHLDHFADFDQLLRAQLDSDNRLRVFGPSGITAKIAHKLAAYSWNLDVPSDVGFSILVTEIASDTNAVQTGFHLRNKFAAGRPSASETPDGRLLEDHDILVDGTLLDHKLPCLGFAVQEQSANHIDDEKLTALNLPRGRWLYRLRQALLNALPPETQIEIDEIHGSMSLGDLRKAITTREPGRKICYVTDCQFNKENARRIIRLARNADTLYIESKFSTADAALAHTRYHLTSDQAGLLAARAGARTIEPFHFSLRYRECEQMMLDEVESAFYSYGRDEAADTDFAGTDFNERNEPK